MHCGHAASAAVFSDSDYQVTSYGVTPRGSSLITRWSGHGQALHAFGYANRPLGVSCMRVTGVGPLGTLADHSTRLINSTFLTEDSHALVQTRALAID